MARLDPVWRIDGASVFNNKRTVFEDEIIAQNEKFKADYPREYETWAMTEDTTFKSKYNSSQEVDVLEQRPEMVVLWAGYAFSRHYNTPRGHKHALEDMRKILRTGNPGIMVKTADGSDSIAVDMQPATCWTCKGPDVPRMMRELGNGKDQFDPANFYAKKWSELGAEEVNTIGCSDCHDARTMDLRPLPIRKCVRWYALSATWSTTSSSLTTRRIPARPTIWYSRTTRD